MAIVGCLGDIIFSVSEQTVKTISNWTWSGSVRYANHQRHNFHTLTEYTGMDADKITFDIMLVAELGVKPLDEIVKLWKYEREGVPLPLTIGKKAYGKYRWNIVSFDTDINYTTYKGDIATATVSLKLQEYLRY